MSTMLRSAVMSLLSKTLQTFLYKYLSDVDVEGVAMPSLIDVDGQSGWGVRLCNVRLREGVELMTLPGKRIIKKKKKKQTRSRANTNTSEHANHVTKDPKQVDSTTPATIQEPSDNPKDNYKDDKTPKSARPRMLTEDDTQVDSGLSSRAPSPPPIICNTATATAVLGCLNRGNRAKESHEHEDSEVETPSAPSAPQSQGNPLIGLRGDELLKTNVVFDTKKLEEPQMPEEPVTADEEEGVKPEEEEEEDDFILCEQDVVLRLGNGGRIGTLDVRLVGKDLHVMVEDAFLAVDVCPQPDVDDDASKDTATTSDTTKDDSSNKKKSTPSPSKRKEPKTAGEKVVDKSAIARALSAIPHLLLRDCRIRLTVHDKPVGATKTVDDDDEDTFGAAEMTMDDSVVELNVEMLSVTSGEDFLAHVRAEENHRDASGRQDLGTESSRSHSLARAPEEPNQNEFLHKRIRTGKGPEGGISIKVFPPLRRRLGHSFVLAKEGSSEWALERYKTRSQFCLFRCSGLDLRARIYLGKKKEVVLRNNDYAWYGDEYDEYTIDSMLYGVDYIAPMPHPPLPPLEPVQRTASDVVPKKQQSEADGYTTDGNGIQSSKVPSCFHSVARGLHPILCEKDHLPCENSPYSWGDTSRPNSYSKNPLDFSMPLPGVVMHLSCNDPIEVNVDRLALEVLGDLQELFTPPKGSNTPTEQEKETAKEEANKAHEYKSDGQSSWPFGKPKRESLQDAFPSYFQPETIEVAGVYLAKIVFRIHVMKSAPVNDSGLTFRYWEGEFKCITMDIQKHNSHMKDLLDLRFDVGCIAFDESSGMVENRLMTVGSPNIDTTNKGDVLPVARPSKHGSPWPSTAAVLLQIRPPIGSIGYESRERHAIQLRFVSLDSPQQDTTETTVNVRVGVVNMDMAMEAPEEMSEVSTEALKILFKETDAPKDQTETDTSNNEADDSKTENNQSLLIPDADKPSMLKYIVRADGANITIRPAIQVRVPLMRFGGKLSSRSGLFLETLLNQVAFEYGQRTAQEQPPRELNIYQLADFPESVRLRILLFLKDLSPLETALGVKRESNSFLRCRAVNRAIVKAGKRKAKDTKQNDQSTGTKLTRREELLGELMRLDDAALDTLLQSHKKAQTT